MKKQMSVRELVLTALFAALTAVGAFIRIPTPVSAFTLQVLFVFMAGTLLGPGYGAVSQVVYVALGLVGLPIFTNGGGFAYVLQPTFGFLLGNIPAAALVGQLCRTNGDEPSFRRITLSCLAGLGIIYLVGLPYMGLILNLYLGQEMGVRAVLMSGMVIFLPFDALKIVVTGFLSQKLIPVLNRIRAVHH